MIIFSSNDIKDGDINYNNILVFYVLFNKKWVKWYVRCLCLRIFCVISWMYVLKWGMFNV